MRHPIEPLARVLSCRSAGRALGAMGLIAAAAGAARAAPAELALGEAQLELAPRRDWLDKESQDPPVRAAAFAQVSGGGEGGGDLGVGGAFAMAGLGCDLVNVAVQGRLRPFAEERAVGDARYSLCLVGIGLTVMFEGRHGGGLAPAIDARRSLWRRRYDLTYERMTAGVGEIPSGRHHHSVLMMGLGHGTTRQVDGEDEREIDQIDIEAVPYGYRYGAPGLALRLEALVLGVDAIKAGRSNLGGVAMAFQLVRAAIDRGRWFAAVRGGWGITGGRLTASRRTEVDGEVVRSWSDTIDGTGLPQLTRRVGEVTAGARVARVEASASLQRSFYPTFDGNLALEERASGSLAYALGRRRATTLRLAPFAARTWTWTREEGSSYEVSAGASVHAGHALAGRLRLDAIGEAGVTPYARLDGARDPESKLGGRLMVAVSAVGAR